MSAIDAFTGAERQSNGTEHGITRILR